MRPEPTEDLYFVADGSGGHVFAKTLAEQNHNIAQYRRGLPADAEAEPVPAAAAAISAPAPPPEKPPPPSRAARQAARRCGSAGHPCLR
jgi:peptidoglycan lytic transglycosylase G